MVTFGEWEDLTYIQFTKDELISAPESHGTRKYYHLNLRINPTHLIPMAAGIDKTFTSGGVSPELKLSFAITETPQERVRGEAIGRDESLEIGMFIPQFIEWRRYSYFCSL